MSPNGPPKGGPLGANRDEQTGVAARRSIGASEEPGTEAGRRSQLAGVELPELRTRQGQRGGLPVAGRKDRDRISGKEAGLAGDRQRAATAADRKSKQRESNTKENIAERGHFKRGKRGDISEELRHTFTLPLTGQS